MPFRFFFISYPFKTIFMLSELVKSLNKEEIRHFKLVSQSVKNSSSRLDLELFDTIRYGDGEGAFRVKKYPGNDNAFYRLKNRLQSKIAKSLLLLHSSDNLHHETLEFVLLAKLWHGRGRHELAYFFLRKAEKKANDLDNYDYINIIYQEYIELAYHITEIPLEEIVSRQKKVLEKQQKINELNNVLAIVKHQLRRTQNLIKGNKEIEDLLRDVVERYSTDQSLKSSFQFRYSIFQAITQFLLQQEKYGALVEFVETAISEFDSDGLFSKVNHESKLQMMIYLINASFKSKDHEKSLKYTESFYDEMLRFGGAYHKKYLFFYYQSLVINFSDSQPQKAVRILEEIRDDRDFVSDPYLAQFIHLNLVIINFKLEIYDKSLASINDLHRSKFFAQFDQSFQREMRILRLVILYQLEDYEKVIELGKEMISVLEKSEEPERTFYLPFTRSMVWLAKRDDFEVSETLKNICKEELSSYLGEGRDSSVFDFLGWIRGVID